MGKRRKNRSQRFEESIREMQASDEIMEKKQVRHASKKKGWLHGDHFFRFIILIMVGVFLAITVKNIYTLQTEKKNLKEENEKLTLEKEALKDELENVSDKEYIEEQARIQLKLIKPGEILYILEDEKEGRIK